MDLPTRPPPPPPSRAPVAVALRRAEPALAARLATLGGVRLVTDPAAADVVVAEAAEPGREDAPLLVLAEGAAAVAALRAG
ncbi:hypothetical protein E2C05_31875, partial [Paracraurococcus ruber]